MFLRTFQNTLRRWLGVLAVTLLSSSNPVADGPPTTVISNEAGKEPITFFHHTHLFKPGLKDDAQRRRFRDERVPATSNPASTLAGCDDLLPVRFDSHPDPLHQRLTNGTKAIPIAADLLEENGEPMFTGLES